MVGQFFFDVAPIDLCEWLFEIISPCDYHMAAAYGLGFTVPFWSGSLSIVAEWLQGSVIKGRLVNERAKAPPSEVTTVGSQT